MGPVLGCSGRGKLPRPDFRQPCPELVGLWRVRRRFSVVPRTSCRCFKYRYLWSGMCRQDAFYEHYFESQREHIFRNVELLIYVWDIQSRDTEVR
jgi:hypothetical protein